MKILLLTVGKTTKSFLREGIDEYVGRLKHYVPFEIQSVADVKGGKKLSQEQQKVAEGKSILACLDSSDHVVLLDERGKEMRSLELAEYMNRRMLSGVKRLVFVVGGPYGFSGEVYQRANDKLSLSKMTFSHEMIRLLFVEQIYRAYTIINHEPYHHE